MVTIRNSQFQQMAQGTPGVPTIQPCKSTATWIEVHLVDSNDIAVGGASYRIKMPDGSVRVGKLDDQGNVRFESILPGTCKVSFPEIHADEWHPA